MKLNKYFVIDFDSTFTKVEAFDVLADISLDSHPEKEILKNKIKDITNQGMDGSISFRDSLEQRVHILSPNRKHLEKLVVVLKEQVSESFKRNKEFFQKYGSGVVGTGIQRVNVTCAVSDHTHADLITSTRHELCFTSIPVRLPVLVPGTSTSMYKYRTVVPF